MLLNNKVKHTMCGIAGIFNLDRSQSHNNFKENDRCDSSPWTRWRVNTLIAFFGMRHRRLAIIDLTPAGDQTIVSANKQFILSYNGGV